MKSWYLLNWSKHSLLKESKSSLSCSQEPATGYRCYFLGLKWPECKVSTHFRLVPRLRINGGIILYFLYTLMAWIGSLPFSLRCMSLYHALSQFITSCRCFLNFWFNISLPAVLDLPCGSPIWVSFTKFLH